MIVGYHRAFAGDVRHLVDQYFRISPTIAERLRQEIDQGIEQIKLGPGSAGHFVNTGSKIVPSVRRHNLRKFPFFIVYSFDGERLFFGAIIPSKSDPLTWLARWR